MAEWFGCNSEGAAPEPFMKSIYKVHNHLVSVHPVEQPEGHGSLSLEIRLSALESNQSCTVLQCMDVDKPVCSGSRKAAYR